MTTAQEVAAHINDLLPNVRGGSLCIFGEWFGGRPDNWHEVTEAAAEGDALIVRFNERETLTVVRPRGVTVTEDEFRIERADVVRWEWFYYGRPARPENLYVMEYARRGDAVEVTDTADWYEPEHHPDATASAVLMG